MKKHILMIIAIGLIFGTMFASVQSVYAASEPEGCITFTSSESFSVSLGDSGTGNTWDGTVQVSVDGTDWQDYTAGTTIDSERSSNGEYSVFFRGEGNSIISGWLDTSFQLTGSSISCSGNIENLLDYKKVQNNEHPEMGEAAFNGLFSGCTSLTTAPELPATTLAEGCYYSMFHRCTSLTTAPELPATTLAEGCYFSMFHRCTSLTTAPELPATTLAGDCYESMFVDCRSLTTAPELPATTLADHCYYTMFRGCTSLTEAPELPATTLARSCYSFMFQYCTSLTTAPELPATTLADYCYELMFENCTNLTTAPELPATTLAKHCYNSMFASCSSLTTAPELPATTLADSCYYDMFCGCTSLTTAPELPATTLADSCYSMMFAACMSLTEAPELPATTLADSCYAEMFDGCSSLTTAPELPATTLADSCYAEMFDGTDVKLSEKKGIFKGIFYGIPYRIPKEGDGTDASNARLNMFENTRGPFTGTPELNKTYYLATPGSGIEKNPYIISNAGVWNSLSGLVKDGFNMEGLFFKLGADIEVTEMVGIKGKPFSGSFDGDGHTLTFNTEANDQHCAPFAYTNNAEFKNLHIAGTIKTDQKLAAGLIGFSEGRAKVTNCRSSITIESSVNGDGTHGGFIAEGGADFEGCVFDGALLGSKTRLCGGFLGWASPEGACSFRNCLFAPQELVLDGAQDNQALTPFGRHVTAATPIENCYYTKIIDRIQGKAGRSVTVGQGITVGSENAKEYKVSGITAFDTGLAYGDAFYAEKDEVIPITIPFIPSFCDAFSASAGTLTGGGTSYMLTIPDEDVTLTLAKGANHAWGAWTKLDENQHQRICGNDPDHRETGDHTWDDGVVTKEPTIKEAGVKTFTCGVCKAERTEALPRLDIDPITPSDDTADDTTVDDQIPVVNTAKIMTKGNFTKKQMKLVFPADKSVTNYRIQYRMAGKKTWKSDWSAGTDMYVIGGVKKSSLCEFRIAGFVKLTDGSWIRGKWSKVSYRYMSAVPLKNAKAGPKCITVTWTKDRKASGYEVKYSLKKSMAGAKTIYVKGGSKTKLTIKKLKSGKKYYVQIRPAKMKSGKRYVGILTNVKAARVK